VPTTWWLHRGANEKPLSVEVNVVCVRKAPDIPSMAPTASPTPPTSAPTVSPTVAPTHAPTPTPSFAPTNSSVDGEISSAAAQAMEEMSRPQLVPNTTSTRVAATKAEAARVHQHQGVAMYHGPSVHGHTDPNLAKGWEETQAAVSADAHQAGREFKSLATQEARAVNEETRRTGLGNRKKGAVVNRWVECKVEATCISYII
jgi:hypothetical protein